MKNTGLLFASAIGGAIVGSVVTCFLKSAKVAEMRNQAHEKIIRELRHLHAHLSNGMCKCSEDGECSCSMDSMTQAPTSQGNEQNNG